MKLIIFILLVCLSAQGSESSNSGPLLDGNIQPLSSLDYIEHLEGLKDDFAEATKTSILKLSNGDKQYLKSIYENITKNNELFFTNKNKPMFFIIKDQTPYHFSLPNMNIYISSGLLERYIKNEKVLYCMLVYEFIKSEKNIYPKVEIIPTGYIESKRLLSLIKISVENKVKIHQWAIYLLKRVGVETDDYLSWIQIQNRNAVDFSTQLGDITEISKEEALFKSFIFSKTKDSLKSLKAYEGSSRRFYRLISNLKRNI